MLIRKTSIMVFLFFSLLFVLCVAKAEQNGNVTDKSSIDKILHSVPNQDKSMPYKNLAERLPNLGLTVNRIESGKLQSDEIKTSNGLYKQGDILFTFFTNAPNDVVKTMCPIWSSFAFVKRGNQWRPDDLTANFLSTSKCIAP